MKWRMFVGAICVGLVIYFLSGNEGTEDEPLPEVIESSSVPEIVADDIAQPAAQPDKANEDVVLTKVSEPAKDGLAKLEAESAPNNIPLTEEEMEELEEYFEKIEEEWGEMLENLFKQELQLSKQTIEQYEDLREGFEEEKLAAFQEYHEKMVAKHGDNYAYRPSADEKIFEKKVLDEYYDRLRKTLGDEAYNRYSEVRERFNERIKSEQDPSKGVLVIDF